MSALYCVLAVALVGWIGVFGYLMRIDSKVRKLEK